MRRILLATDGSSDAQEACTWLGSSPLPPHATVRVVSVAMVPSSPLDVAPVRDYQASLRQQARGVADGACATLASRFRTIEAHVVDGDPREEIVRAAEEWPADLVVLGARGLTSVARFLIGSVSLAVARHAHCPVLVVKGSARAVRRMVVAVDGSEQAALAAACVRRLAVAGARVTLVGVVELPRLLSAVSPVESASPAVIEAIVAERTTALEHALSRAQATLEDSVASVEQRLASGYPAEEILRAASEDDSDVVVVGARGLGLLKRLLLGSVSEAVLRHADRPVLIVRGGTP
jgi:nucleotide-binding universal stress UspA family protein